MDRIISAKYELRTAIPTRIDDSAAPMRDERKSVKTQRRAPRQKRARVTHDAILEAAARIIEDQDTVVLTTNRIAERAGVSIGTLYGYFRNKQEILIALARQILEEDRQTVADALANPDVDKVAVVIHALFARHTLSKRLRRTTMSVHQSEGHGSEHVRNVDWFLTAVRQYREFDDVSEVRMMVAVQATLGIARTLTDDAYDIDSSTLGMMETETVALIKKALLS